MAALQDLIELLVQVLRDRARRVDHVKRFQELVWASEILDAAPDRVQLLRDLAYDLDFFEPDEQIRADDPAFYGDARLEEEIRSALRRLGSQALVD